MRWKAIRMLCLGTLLLTWGRPVQAQAAPQAGMQASELPAMPAEELTLHGAEAPAALHRFWFVGTSNYHNKLSAAEDQIDEQINATFGKLFWNWKKPRTFQDWRDEMRIWDLWAGYGQDINDQLSWTVYGGGGRGMIKNERKHHPLFIPLRLNMDFTRTSIMCGSSLVYHPWGRPRYQGKSLGAILKSTRPSIEMNLGYTRQQSKADVRITVPGLRDLARIKQEEWMHLFWASPRAGVEMALNERDSLNLVGGYLFFNRMTDDFDGWLWEIFYRHRF